MTRSWRLADFIVIWLAGVVGAVVLGVVGEAAGSPDSAIALGLAGQYIGSLGVYFWMARDRHPLDMGIKGSDFGFVALGLLFQILMAALLFPLTELLFPDGRPPQEVAEMIAESDSAVIQISLVVAAVLLAPVTEEIMYRGVLLAPLERRSRRFAVVMSALVFSLVHITGLDFDRLWASAAVVLPPLFILGMVLAWMVFKYGRLGPAIMLHSGWNLLAAFVLLLPPELLE